MPRKKQSNLVSKVILTHWPDSWVHLDRYYTLSKRFRIKCLRKAVVQPIRYDPEGKYAVKLLWQDYGKWKEGWEIKVHASDLVPLSPKYSK